MLVYLLLTIAIEIPIYFLFDRSRIAYTTLILILANCITWPLLHIFLQTTSIPLVVLETGVTIVEAFIIFNFLNQKISKAFLISFIQNTTTTLIGVFLNKYF
ncbi:MAG: hypothetical protein KDD21_11535 [Bacteroidetes bacterium]|nr:hypothetical protein [Bacteroidota bacterium]